MEYIPSIEKLQEEISVAVVEGFRIQDILPLKRFISRYLKVRHDELEADNNWEAKEWLNALESSSSWQDVVRLCARMPVGLLSMEIWSRLWPYLVLADEETCRRTQGISESDSFLLRPTFHASDMDYLNASSRKLALLGEIYDGKQLGIILDYVFYFVLKGDAGAKQTLKSMLVLWSSIRPNYVDYLKEEN